MGPWPPPQMLQARTATVNGNLGYLTPFSRVLAVFFSSRDRRRSSLRSACAGQRWHNHLSVLQLVICANVRSIRLTGHTTYCVTLCPFRTTPARGARPKSLLWAGELRSHSAVLFIWSVYTLRNYSLTSLYNRRHYGSCPSVRLSIDALQQWCRPAVGVLHSCRPSSSVVLCNGCIVAKRCKIWPSLLITHRKSNTGF